MDVHSCHISNLNLELIELVMYFIFFIVTYM